MKCVVGISYTLKEVQYNDDFIVLDDKFDVILRLQWLRKYEPQVSWHRRSVDITAACSPDAHLMNVLERPPPCGCTTSEYDGLTCGSAVSTTAQDRNMTNHHIAEQVPGDCTTTQEAAKAHHSNTSSGPGHNSPPCGQLLDPDQLIANDCKYGSEIAKKARVEGIRPQQTV